MIVHVPAFSFILASLLLQPFSAAQAPRAVPIDGEPFQGKLIGIETGGQIIFAVAGKQRTIPSGDLLCWGLPAEFHKGPIVVLADGGRLQGAIAGADETHLAVNSSRCGALKLPLETLAGIVYRMPPQRQDLDALIDRLMQSKGQADHVLLDNGDEIAGLIKSLAADKLAIKSDLGVVDVAVERIVAVIFNPALRQAPAAQSNAAWIGLDDGSRLLAGSPMLQGDALEMTVAGKPWKAKAEHLVFFMPQSGRALFLSDVPPDKYVFLPYLDMRWPYRTDRNVTGGQLRCGGQLYLKGLGIHSAARLSYQLDRPWRRFQAEIGIDDSTAGRGSAGFRVFVDGKLKFANPTVRGGAAPQAISVDLADAKRLDLVVDYGEAGDVLDHADWLNARLVR